jgi:hypothetical protein
MPENETWKPRSSAARATSAVSVKQWKTPPALPGEPSSPSSFRIASVSADAARVWMISGLPHWRAARMWRAEALALPLHVAHVRPPLRSSIW